VTSAAKQISRTGVGFSSNSFLEVFANVC
jgi:hypothetical protein